MIWQYVITALVFLAALFYMGRKFWNSLYRKKGCGSNCKCGVNFDEIEKKVS